MSASAQSLTQPPARLARLDGLRGIAACMVAFGYHGTVLYAPGALAGSPWPLALIRQWGWTFVDLFFVLSGFVFAHVYLATDWRGRPGAWGAFWRARLARLYPLHLATLLVVAPFRWGTPGNGAETFAAHLLMAQAFVGPVSHSFVGPSWSISVEMACYGLFALGAIGGPRVSRWLGAALLLLAADWLWLLGLPGGPWGGEVLARGLLGFFAGQLLWRWRDRLADLPGWALVLVAMIGLAVARHNELAGRGSAVLVLGLLVWPAVVGLALRLAWLESRPLQWLGARSYGIYLLHGPLADAGRTLFGPLPGGALAQAVGHFALVATTLALADLTLRWIEAPARHWLRRAGRGEAALPPAAPPAALLTFR